MNYRFNRRKPIGSLSIEQQEALIDLAKEALHTLSDFEDNIPFRLPREYFDIWRAWSDAVSEMEDSVYGPNKYGPFINKIGPFGGKQ